MTCNLEDYKDLLNCTSLNDIRSFQDEVLKYNIIVFKRLPRCSRIPEVRKLVDIIGACVHQISVRAWKVLFLSYKALHISPKI